MKPETITFTASGELIESLRAISFISGAGISEVVRNILSGYADRARRPAELLEDSFFSMRKGDTDIAAMIGRFKQYRDAHGLDYEDYRIDADISHCRCEIDDDERSMLLQAAEILSGRTEVEVNEN